MIRMKKKKDLLDFIDQKVCRICKGKNIKFTAVNIKFMGKFISNSYPLYLCEECYNKFFDQIST